MILNTIYSSQSRVLTALEVAGDWTNTQFVSSAVDTTGLVFTASYNNGTSKTVTPIVTPSVWGATAGSQTATFSFTDGSTTKTCTKSATIVKPSLTELTVSGDWTNTQYTSTAVDTTGLTFTAKFNNGSTKTVTPSHSPMNWSGTAGTQTCTFSYTEDSITKTCTKNANVEALVLTDLTVSGSWTNAQYTLGSVDTTGLTFTASYNNGSTKTVTPTVSPSTWADTVGTQTATFSYTEGSVTKTCTKDANVLASILTGLAVEGSWTNTQYASTTVDPTGLSFKASYNSGATKYVTPTVTPTSWTATVGTQTATFSYTEGGVTKTCTKDATVVAVELTGLAVEGSFTNTQYASSTVDTTGLSCKASYNNGTSKTVTATSYSPTTWSATVGTQTLTFTYTEGGITKTATKDATVVAVALSGLSVSGDWTNAQHTGSPVDYTGLTFTATFNNGTSKTVTPTSYTPTTWGSTEGTQTCTFTYTEGGVSKDCTKDANVTKVSCYGVEWDGSETTAWTRTDGAVTFTDPVPYVAGATSYSSPFDNISPWKDIAIVDDSEAGKLVKIPKFYYKWTFDGDKMKLQVSSATFTGASVSPAHCDRGDGKGERDYVYVGRYHCAASTYKSTSGVKPQVSKTRSAFRTSISALGSTVWQWDYAMLSTIQMLYLVEFADWNTQAKIGGGCSATTSTSSAVYNMGSTDSMPYHTGTVSSSHSAYGACQYRYIENLWGNCRDWCDGVYFNGQKSYAILNPANFSDSSGGTLVHSTRDVSNYGCIKKYSQSTVSGYEWFLQPTDASGGTDYSKYVSDQCYYSSSYVVLYVGGSYVQSQDYGLFCLGDLSVSNSNASIGSRLMKL